MGNVIERAREHARRGSACSNNYTSGDKVKKWGANDARTGIRLDCR